MSSEKYKIGQIFRYCREYDKNAFYFLAIITEESKSAGYHLISLKDGKDFGWWLKYEIDYCWKKINTITKNKFD